MTGEDSLPKLRFATFCRMALFDQQGEQTLVGLMPAITLNIRPESEQEPPEAVEFHVQNIALYACFDPPLKRGLVTVETTLTSPDMLGFKMDPIKNVLNFESPGINLGNLTIRLDGFKLPVAVDDKKYTVNAKWKVDQKTIGRLDLPINVLVVKPQ